jgi:hypothetical protein
MRPRHTLPAAPLLLTLALFERRPSERVDGLVIPASTKRKAKQSTAQHSTKHKAQKLTFALTQGRYVGRCFDSHDFVISIAPGRMVNSHRR